jgi:hypothetical protein
MNLNQLKKTAFLVLFTLASATGFSRSAQAGVFNLPQFVEFQSWAVGMEPEVTLTSGGGFATNFKFTYGITPLNNIQAIVGFGSGARGFRVGGAYTFDFIPDLEGQIGFGVYLQGVYYKLRGAVSSTEVTLTPYIHNAFETSSGTSFDPYIALPVGIDFILGTYNTIAQLVLGSYFPTSQHFGFNAELGLNLNQTDSYIAVGVTYRD